MRRVLVGLALALSAPAWAGKGAGADLPALPSAYGGEDAGQISDAPWWLRFDDPGLQTVMRTALGDNYDLRAAYDRVRISRAATIQAMASVLPQVKVDSSVAAQTAEARAARMGFLEADQLPNFVYDGSANLTANLGLDLFGRNTLGIQAAGHDVDAAEADYDEMAMAVAVRVASSWFDVALHNQRITLLTEQLAINGRVLELVQMRFERSEASAVEVLQQQQQVAAVRANLPLVIAARDSAAQQLAVLLGMAPSSLDAQMPTSLPEAPALPALGHPNDLLRNRPDLRAAEERLTSAWQRRMASERAFLPTFAANFNAGWTFGNAQQIEFGLDGATVSYGSAFGWGFGGSVSLPVFDGALSIGRLRQARASESAAANTLGGSSLAAVAEVESAVTLARGQTERLGAIRTQQAAAVAAFDAALSRYGEGIGDYLSVLSSLVAMQNAQLTELQASRDVLTSHLQLHDALGGAWTHSIAQRAGGQP